MVHLPAPATRESEFCMYASFPMDLNGNLTGFGVHVGNDLFDQCPHDPLLQTGVTLRRPPDLFQFAG